MKVVIVGIGKIGKEYLKILIKNKKDYQNLLN